MLWLAVAAFTASTPSHPAPLVAVQAKATVRIMSGARIDFAGNGGPDLPRPRQTVVRTNGTIQPAHLIEFE